MSEIEKQQFRNNSSGWVGAVVIGPKGDDKGIPVEPGGTVWLSEAEQRLTANAPRRPEDNPFVEQKFSRTDPVTGDLEEISLTPLEPISEGRYVPADERYVPAAASDAQMTQAAQAAATGDEPQTAVLQQSSVETRTAEVDEDTKPNQPPVPPRAAAAARNAPPEEKQAPEEEQAAKTDPQVGEETGAAPPPSGPQPEGEYAASEEVGTPVRQKPVPWSPGSTEG